MGLLKIEHVIPWPDLFHLTHNKEYLYSDCYLGHMCEPLMAGRESAVVLLYLVIRCDLSRHLSLTLCLQVVGFIASMLQRACVSLERGTDSPVESQTLSMGIGLVATLLSGAAEVVYSLYILLLFFAHSVPLVICC